MLIYTSASSIYLAGDCHGLRPRNDSSFVRRSKAVTAQFHKVKGGSVTLPYKNVFIIGTVREDGPYKGCGGRSGVSRGRFMAYLRYSNIRYSFFAKLPA